MAETILYQNSYGIVLSLATGVNMTDTVSLSLRIKSESGEMITHALTPSDIFDKPIGLVKYTVEEGDFVETGIYEIQLIDDSTGKFIPSDIIRLKVIPNLE